MPFTARSAFLAAGERSDSETAPALIWLDDVMR
jgi:hypothetical protein